MDNTLLDRHNSSDDTQPHSIIVLNYATEYIITILKNWTKLNSLPVFFHTVYIGFHISYSFFLKALILIFLKTMLFALCQGFSYYLLVVDFFVRRIKMASCNLHINLLLRHPMWSEGDQALEDISWPAKIFKEQYSIHKSNHGWQQPGWNLQYVEPNCKHIQTYLNLSLSEVTTRKHNKNQVIPFLFRGLRCWVFCEFSVRNSPAKALETKVSR